MAAINFPSNPQIDDIWTENGRSWIFDGTSWNAYGEDVNHVEYTVTTGSAILPKGTTAQRDNPAASGYLRYNTETNQFEGYNGTAWGSVGNPTIVNDSTTNTSYYLTLSTVTSGTTSSLKITSTKLSFNPSTGRLSATQFAGDGSNLTAIPTSALTGTLPGDRGVTAGSTSSSFVEYNGTTKTAGQMYGGASDPTSTTRLNYDGYLHVTKIYGDGSSLTGLSAGALGGGTNDIFWENSTTVTNNYTISTNKNAGTFGPVSINDGVTVTIPTGSAWTVI